MNLYVNNIYLILIIYFILINKSILSCIGYNDFVCE